MPDTVNPQITDAVSETNLAPAVSLALARAMENAVNAQQQLNTLGIAALTQALAVRLSTPEGKAALAAETPAPAEPSVAETLRASIEHARAGAAAEGPLGGARAFAKGLALIDAATAQHMRDIVTVVLLAGIDAADPPGPVEAALITNLLQGNALAQAIANLAAAAGAKG